MIYYCFQIKNTNLISANNQNFIPNLTYFIYTKCFKGSSVLLLLMFKKFKMGFINLLFFKLKIFLFL